MRRDGRRREIFRRRAFVNSRPRRCRHYQRREREQGRHPGRRSVEVAAAPPVRRRPERYLIFRSRARPAAEWKLSQTGPSAAPASARLASHCAVGASSVSAGGRAQRRASATCSRGVCSDVVRCGRGACSACDACSAHTTRRIGRIAALKSSVSTAPAAAPGSLSNYYRSRKAKRRRGCNCAKHLLQRFPRGRREALKALVACAKRLSTRQLLIEWLASAKKFRPFLQSARQPLRPR